MKQIQLSILEIKKYLKKRGFIVSKKISKKKKLLVLMSYQKHFYLA